MQQELTNSNSITQTKVTKKKQFLRLYLEPKTTIMLPIEQVTEVLKITLNKIVPIPQMPPYIMGVYNWRGEILWTADLGQLLGLNSWQQQNIDSNHTTMIIISFAIGSQAKSMHKKSLGLIVNSIEDIEWCDPQFIQPPSSSAINTVLASFVSGYWVQPKKPMSLILDGNSIIDFVK